MRNPKIAEMLYLSEDIEKLGSGLKRIYAECNKNNVQVKFKPIKYGFSVIFKRIYVKDVSEKSSEKIIKLISKNNRITIEELSKRIEISTREIDKNIAKLKELNLLIRVVLIKEDIEKL